MSKLFKEYNEFNFKIITEDIIKYWKNNDIFITKVSKNFYKKNNYIFYEGPPSTNGSPGIHHVMSRTIKDIICRYHTLNGKKVKRQAGWDTHGLPIELEVEKKLGITKEDIGSKITIKDYNNFCKKFVIYYINKWNNLTKKMGFWLDYNNAYITYQSKYIETIWWLLKQLYKKKLLYKGYTIHPYSPFAGTGLSHHELNFPGVFKNIIDLSVTIQFKLEYNSLPKKLQILSKQDNIFILSWTTTPWTLPSNTALAIDENINYVLIKTYNKYNKLLIYIILSEFLIKKNLINNYFYVKNEIEFQKQSKNLNIKIPFLILSKFQGKEIIGVKYEQVIKWHQPYKNIENAFQIIKCDFINNNEGTGIIHIAPTFGIDDANIAKKYNIPSMLILNKQKIPIPLVDLQGKFININIPIEFAGKYIKNEYYKKYNNSSIEESIDYKIISLLKNNNQVFDEKEYLHSYPHCWRTEKPIIYYPLNSWMIKTTNFKHKMHVLNKKINWYPSSIGKNRFNNWLKNIKDWNLSRSRYWGTPLPIWTTEDGKEEIIIGSIEELIIEIKKSIKKGFMKKNPFKNFVIGDMNDKNYDNIDLHKHILDNIILVSNSNKPMKREEEIIDVWFESGAMPYASLHYPFENKQLIDNKIHYPADFIAEGIDQTRGWFYTLHAISTILFNSIAFKNVIPNGLILDKKGHKMSKSKGNVIDPIKVLLNYGADATRWYMISNSDIWENTKFNLNEIKNINKKFFLVLYNIYSFFALYANIDKFKYLEDNIPIINKNIIDKWILSLLNNLIKKVDYYYNNYNLREVTKIIQEFVDKLSNIYIRICRRRFWKNIYNIDKISAYQTLYNCLINLSKLLAPIAPFFADRLYQDLNKTTKKENYISVHLSKFPIYNKLFINHKLEKCVLFIQKIIYMIFSLRKKHNIKVRQPLKKMIIYLHNHNINIFNSFQEEITKWILKEVNIKKLIFLTKINNNDIFIKKIKVNYKILGPKYGKNIKNIVQKLENITQQEITNFEKYGQYEFMLNNIKICIFLSEVYILTKEIKGWAFLSDKDISIALDISINQNLLEECFCRSLINAIQKLRKKNNLQVIDRIYIYLKIPNIFKKSIEKYKDFISNEILAKKIFLQEINEINKELLIVEGYQVEVFIKKI